MNLLRRLGTFLLLATLAWAPAQEGRSSRPSAPAPTTARAEGIPEQARKVLAYVRAHGQAPPNTVGGRRFGNYEHRLPERDAQGRPIRYQEWDLWPKVPGRNRGPERLVTGSDNRAWYTGDHYAHFKEVRE